MITAIEGLPGNVVGLRAEGTVHAADYTSVLDPAVEAARKQHDKIRMLYVLADDFEGYSAGALWQDTKVGLSDWSAFERIAIVTDRTAWVDAIKALGWLMPGEARAFPVSDLDEATRWVSQ